MKSRTRSTHHHALALGLGALLLAAAGCSGSSGAPPEDAPDFALTDANAASPTFGETRSLAGAEGRVLVMHFVLYT